MAADSRDALLDLVRTQVLTVASIGKVFRGLPRWLTTTAWEADTKALINGKSLHRFWTIDHHVTSDVFSFGAGKGTDMVTHMVSIIGYVAALLDTEDDGLDTEAETRDLVALVLSALRNPDDVSPNTNFCGYAVEELPQEDEDLDLVSFQGQDFHQPTISFGILEEVAR